MNLRNQTIKVTEDNYKEVQEELFRQGYKWIDSGNVILPFRGGFSYYETDENGHICLSSRGGGLTVSGEDFLKESKKENMKFIKQAIEVTPDNHTAVQQKLLQQGYIWINGKEFVSWYDDNHYIGTNETGYIFWVHKNDVCYRTKLTAEEFLKDAMKPFYIYTPTPKISQEVQKRLFELGYEWCQGSKHEILEESCCLRFLKVDGKIVSQSDANYSNSKEVSLKELFSKDFPPYAEPGRHIPKGELLPDYEVVVTKDFLEIPEISVKIPMEEIRNLAAAINAPVPKLKKIYIHAPGPELMKFVYEKLVSMGYEGHADHSYICLDSYGKICWDAGKQYVINIGYKEMTIPELFSLASPPLPDLAGYKVSLTGDTLKVGCQKIPLAKLQGDQAPLGTPIFARFFKNIGESLVSP